MSHPFLERSVEVTRYHPKEDRACRTWIISRRKGIASYPPPPDPAGISQSSKNIRVHEKEQRRGKIIRCEEGRK